MGLLPPTSIPFFDILYKSKRRKLENTYPKGEILTNLCKILHTNADFLLGLTYDYHMQKTPVKLSDSDWKMLRLYKQLSPEDKIRAEERILTLSEKN